MIATGLLSWHAQDCAKTLLQSLIYGTPSPKRCEQLPLLLHLRDLPFLICFIQITSFFEEGLLTPIPPPLSQDVLYFSVELISELISKLLSICIGFTMLSRFCKLLHLYDMCGIQFKCTCGAEVEKWWLTYQLHCSNKI